MKMYYFSASQSDADSLDKFFGGTFGREFVRLLLGDEVFANYKVVSDGLQVRVVDF